MGKDLCLNYKGYVNVNIVDCFSRCALGGALNNNPAKKVGVVVGKWM